MEYRLLGPLEVYDAGARIAIGGARARAVLGRLLIAAGRPVPSETLIHELWGDEPPATATATLQTYVSRLRRALPDGALVTEAGGYALRPGPEEVDRDRFETLTAAGRAALAARNPERAAKLFLQAVELWRGPPLAELADTERGAIEIARLEELRRAAEEDRFDAELAAGGHARVLADLERAVAEQPLRERRWGQLMLALYRTGRQADATRRFQELRHLLGEELGLEPSPELTRLEQAILDQDPALDAPAPAGARAPGKALPVPVTSFIGRRVEAAELDAAMRANRLVTVVGPGGVGKTRLVVELGRARAAEGDADVLLVELASHTDAQQVAAAVAAGLGVTGSPAGLAEDAAAALGDTPTLLLLDNCEHVVAEVAALSDELLTAVATLHIVATSREPLAVPGEAVWRLRPLGSDDAVELFRARAGQADPGEDVRLRTVCARLDDLPLAIELAAARLRTMDLDRLISGLEDQFRLLGTGPRTGPERQRTLRALVKWSHDLLAPEEQTLFAVLSVFAGGFDPRAAAGLAATVDDLESVDTESALADLADKSLLDVESGGRYRMLDTIRAFARERLDAAGLTAAARSAHLEFYVSLASQAGDNLHREGQSEWLARLDQEHPNIRAALEWALEDPARASSALEVGVALFRFWFVRGHLGEGRRLLEAALEVSEGPPSSAHAWAHLRAGGLCGEQGDQVAARQHLDAALAHAVELGDHDVEALAINEMGQSERASGELVRAVEHAERAVAVARAGARPHTLATCLANMAAAVLAGGRYTEARAYFEEARGLHELGGDVFGLGVVLGNLAVAAFQEGDLVACRQYIAEANALHRRVGNRHGLATSQVMAAQVGLVEGDLDSAEVAALEALEVMRDQSRSVNLSITLGTLAEIRLALGKPAEDVIAEKLALDRAIGFAAGEAMGLVMLARSHVAAGDLEAAAAAAEEAVGTSRGSGYELVLGTALGVTGLVASRQERRDEAAAAYREAIEVLRPVEAHRELAQVLREYAELAEASEDFDLAFALRAELDQITHLAD